MIYRAKMTWHENDSEDGCPDLDNDQDGIQDHVDKCPNEAEDFDGDQDEDGCPDLYEKIVITETRIELKQKIFFATGRARIKRQSFDLLNEVVDDVAGTPGDDEFMFNSQ